MYKRKKEISLILIIFILVMMLSGFKASLCLLGNEEDYLGKKAQIIVSATGDFREPKEVTLKYDITPERSNLSGASNEPTEVTVTLNSTTDVISEGRLSKSCEIDFTNTTYTKPGVYKYLITEKYCSNETEFPRNTKKYRIAVEAVKESNGSISHSFYKYAFDLENDTKEERIAFNHTQMTYLKFQMQTTGQLADPDQYFKLTVSIFGREGDIYNISGQDSVVTYNGEQINTINSFDIYLKNGQTVYIGTKTVNGVEYYQIPVGTYVSIVENEATNYQTFINEEEGKVRINIYLTGDIEDNIINVINHSDYDDTRTVVFFSILPYVIISLIVIGLLIFLACKKMKDKKNDENN